MTPGMNPWLAAFVGTFLIHGVSAGGAYCAKSARARAAALGLDYPGKHGAPDLFPPAHYEYEMPHGADNNYKDDNGLKMHHGADSINVGHFDDSQHTSTHPEIFNEFIPSRSSTSYKPGQIQQNAAKMLWIPRGNQVSHRQSGLEKVRGRVGDPPGQFDPVKWDPEGLNDPLWFSSSERDLDDHDHDDDDHDDESSPNSKYDTATSAIFLPLQKSPKAFQRGVARYGRRRKDQRVKKSKNRGGSPSPSLFAAYLRKSLTVKPLSLQGNPVIRRHNAPKRASLTKSW